MKQDLSNIATIFGPRLAGLGNRRSPTYLFGKRGKHRRYQQKERFKPFLSAVSEVLEKVSKGDRERFIRSYQRRLVEKTKKNVKDLVKHFRDPEQGPISILKKEDGSIAGCISEMDELLRKCWPPSLQNTVRAIPNQTLKNL